MGEGEKCSKHCAKCGMRRAADDVGCATSGVTDAVVVGGAADGGSRRTRGSKIDA